MALAWTLPRWYSWGLVTPFIFRLDRRLASSTTLPVRVALHVPLGLAWTAVTIALRLAARPMRGTPLPPGFQRLPARPVLFGPAVYGAIAGIVVARDYAADARRREREAAELAVRAARLEAGLAEARFSALGSQLHPHFLFNALNAVSAFTERDPATARHLMAQLGGLLRASLDHAARPEVTLREELAFLDAFLDIERARFEDRLTVTVAIDDAAGDARVPAFLLQPLVENAIQHGITHARRRAAWSATCRVAADDRAPAHSSPRRRRGASSRMAD